MAAVIVTDNSQVATDTISGHKPPTGKHANIISGSVNATDLATGAVSAGKLAGNAVTSAKVLDQSLTGADIADQSGVDTCTHGTVRFGELCVGVANERHTWGEANDLCANLELRLPSFGEALALAYNHDVPNVDDSEWFWTEETTLVQVGGGSFDLKAYVANELRGMGTMPKTNAAETVCVTTPTN